jgi:GTP cyclohydrolase I
MVNADAVERAIGALLVALGEDVSREGLRATPARAAAGWIELLDGVHRDPVSPLRPLSDEMGFAGQDISLDDVSFTSTCEHHLLPFGGTVRISYRSSGPVAGLSGFVRSIHALGSRLQLQERLTGQIADAIVEALDPEGVMVAVTARHGWVSDRGAKDRAARTTTVVARGCYLASGLRPMSREVK